MNASDNSTGVCVEEHGLGGLVQYWHILVHCEGVGKCFLCHAAYASLHFPGLCVRLVPSCSGEIAWPRPLSPAKAHCGIWD